MTTSRAQPLGLLVALGAAICTPAAASAQIEGFATPDTQWAGCINTPKRACALDRAYVAARTIEDALPRHFTLREIAAAERQAGLSANVASAAAAAALAEARAMSRRAQDLHVVARAQLDAGLTDDAAGTLEGALRAAAGEPQAVWILRSIARAQVRAGRAVQAAATFDMALAATRSLPDSWLRANEPRLIAEAELNASAGDVAASIRQALEAAREIEDLGIRVNALAAIAATQVKAGSAVGAADTFADALRVAETITPQRPRNEALRSIAAKQMEAGLAEAAMATLDRALRVVLPIDYSTLMQTGEDFAKFGQTAKAAAAFERALVAATEIKRTAAIQEGAMWDVARAQVQAGLLKEADASIRRALTLTLSSTGAYDPASPTHKAAADTQNQDAGRLFRVQVLSAFAQAQIAHQQDAGAILETSLRIARTIEDPGWRAAGLLSVARAHAGGSRDAAAPSTEAAAALAQRLEDLKRSRNETARQEGLDRIAYSFIEVAHMLVEIGATDRASEACRQALLTTTRMIYAGPRNAVRRAVAEARASDGRFAEALRAAASIELPLEQAKALIAIADVLPD